MSDEDPQLPDGFLQKFLVKISHEETDFAEHMEEIERDVHNTGWALVGIMLPPGYKVEGEEERTRLFTYTVGLHSLGLPEIGTPGLCGCSDKIVSRLVDRQIRAGAYADRQITQVEGVTVRLAYWRHMSFFRPLNEFFAHHSHPPVVLMATLV